MKPWKIFIGGPGDKSSYATLYEAIKQFIQRMKELLEEGTSWQFFESACWISYDDGETVGYWGGFYRARDTAMNNGWMKDGSSDWIGA